MTRWKEAAESWKSLSLEADHTDFSGVKYDPIVAAYECGADHGAKVERERILETLKRIRGDHNGEWFSDWLDVELREEDGNDK